MFHKHYIIQYNIHENIHVTYSEVHSNSTHVTQMSHNIISIDTETILYKKNHLSNLCITLKSIFDFFVPSVVFPRFN